MNDIEAAAIDSPSAYVAGQAQEYVANDGEGIDHPYADHLVLVYFRGRKTGSIRRVPLVAVGEGDDLYIVASKGGSDTHPVWYLSIADNPDVWVRNKHRFYSARSTVVEGEERSTAWSAIVETMPFFADYERKTDRVMPVIRLSPATH